MPVINNLFLVKSFVVINRVLHARTPTDERAQNITFEVSSSIGMMDLKFIQRADLMKTPVGKKENTVIAECKKKKEASEWKLINIT